MLWLYSNLDDKVIFTINVKNLGKRIMFCQVCDASVFRECVILC